MDDILKGYKDPLLAKKLVERINRYKGEDITLMEVCGTHTMSIFRFGIRDLLPGNVRIISGPGCPVCVTPIDYVNAAVMLSDIEDVIVTTFGDMMRVPGSDTNLISQKAIGKDVRIVYSPLDAVLIAKDNPNKKVVFLSLGFETTTPVIALAIQHALDNKLNNFFVLTANKTVPEALKLLANDPEVNVQGYLYPGHVASITGTAFYDYFCKEYNIAGVITGFEPVDILAAIDRLIENISNRRFMLDNLYRRVVNSKGNTIAQQKVNDVFEPCDAEWRGIGIIPGSGLRLTEKYRKFDAWKKFDLSDAKKDEPKGCSCGEVLKGKIIPYQCKLFGKTCTPEKPVGACMVSSEGTCAAYFKYGKR